MNNSAMGVMDLFMLKISKIRFEDVDDFYRRRKQLRELYEMLSFNEKEMYKWYFHYQLCFVKNPLKKLAWEYINGYDVEAELLSEYVIFLAKRNRLKLLEDVEID